MSVEFDKKSYKKAKKMLPLFSSKINQKYYEMKTLYGDNFLKDELYLKQYSDFLLAMLKDFFEKTELKVKTNFY